MARIKDKDPVIEIALEDRYGLDGTSNGLLSLSHAQLTQALKIGDNVEGSPTLFQDSGEKGQDDGYPDLDSDGKVPLDQLPDNLFDHSLPAGSINFTQAGAGTSPTNLQARGEQWVSLTDFAGVDPTGVADSTSGIAGPLYNIGGDRLTVYVPPGTYKTSLLRTGNVELIGLGKVTFELFEGATPTMGQLNSDTTMSNINVVSTETDLDQQRCTMTNSNNVQLYDCTFQGFRDTTGPGDAWGLYMKGASNARIINCGFDNNTQADIAIVEDNSSIIVEGAYAIGSILHISLEPNSSTTENDGIRIISNKITKLSLLENGSGGTASRGISVDNNVIDLLVYDGSTVDFGSNEVKAIASQTDMFLGNVSSTNTFVVSENLLADPNFSTIAFNSTQAGTDRNDWYLNNRGGAIGGGDEILAGSENKVRYTRFNPNAQNGTVNFRPTVAVAGTSGDTYAVVVTGRNVSGTGGSYLQIDNAGTNIDCRLFRQSNIGAHWSTDVGFFTCGATADVILKIGLWSTDTAIFDLVSITLHKVEAFGPANSWRQSVGSMHEVKGGVRELLLTGANPAFSTANLITQQAGDRVIASTGVHSYWDGTSAFVPM